MTQETERVMLAIPLENVDELRGLFGVFDENIGVLEKPLGEVVRLVGPNVPDVQGRKPAELGDRGHGRMVGHKLHAMGYRTRPSALGSG